MKTYKKKAEKCSIFKEAADLHNKTWWNLQLPGNEKVCKVCHELDLVQTKISQMHKNKNDHTYYSHFNDNDSVFLQQNKNNYELCKYLISHTGAFRQKTRNINRNKL